MLVRGFNFKLTHIVIGLFLRLPLIGPIVGKFIPPIRAMFDAFKVRDNYIDQLIKSKRSELERDNFEVSDGLTGLKEAFGPNLSSISLTSFD